jgi:hypothetical protein
MNTVTYRKYAGLFNEAKAAGTTSVTSVKAYIAELKSQSAAGVEPVQSNILLLTHTKVKKSEHTRRIFREELAVNDGKIVRKSIVARFMEEAGLSFPGANSYLTNMKREFGLL